MGLLGDMFGGLRMKDPVRGTAQVVSCTSHRGDGVMQNCRMQLVVRAEGVPAKAVEHSGLVHYKSWPAPGMTVPVTVDRANPERLKVEWDEIESPSDRAEATAEDLAATVRGIDPDASGARQTGAARPPVPTSTGAEVEERIDRLERLARLHAQGVLTDAELAEQKRQVLDG